ncbi:hypothetical protein BS78_05G052100 [Paspalum vaginatum]|nr:hypothetical protein BS78_05G052100 [Paspalum vaginatum]
MNLACPLMSPPRAVMPAPPPVFLSVVTAAATPFSLPSPPPPPDSWRRCGAPRPGTQASGVGEHSHRPPSFPVPAAAQPRQLRRRTGFRESAPPLPSHCSALTLPWCRSTKERSRSVTALGSLLWMNSASTHAGLTRQEASMKASREAAQSPSNSWCLTGHPHQTQALSPCCCPRGQATIRVRRPYHIFKPSAADQETCVRFVVQLLVEATRTLRFLLSKEIKGYTPPIGLLCEVTAGTSPRLLSTLTPLDIDWFMGKISCCRFIAPS